MKHYFTNRVRVVLLIAVLLAIVLAVVSSLTGSLLPQNLVQGVLAPFRSGVRTVLTPEFSLPASRPGPASPSPPSF